MATPHRDPSASDGPGGGTRLAVRTRGHSITDDELIVSLKEHFETIINLNEKFLEERDRRYAEVNIEREKALKIKETADRLALDLAREIQIYKDEKANALREQIGSERGDYALNKDIEPLKAYVNSQTGRGLGMNALFGWALGLLMAGVAFAELFLRH
jgi:phage anti-repressor protein